MKHAAIYISEEEINNMYFDVINIQDDFVRNTLYGIKLIAQARISKPPHITIRGPSEIPTRVDHLSTLNRKIVGNKFSFDSFGSFSTKNSSVVFIVFSSSKIEAVWNKPSFPQEKYGIIPHITLYDGPDLIFAQNLLDLLQKYPDLDLEIEGEHLEIMGPDTNYSQQLAQAVELVFESHLSKEEITDKLARLNTSDRLHLIDNLMNSLFLKQQMIVSIN